HSLHVEFQWEALDNFENIYRYDNESGGISYVGYYGQLHTTDKTTWNVNAEYTGSFGVTGGCPAWVAKGGFAYYSRDILASVYPYYRKQNLHTATFHVSGEYNICKPKDRYTLYIGGSYASGNGDVKEDATYATPTESQSAPKSMDTFLYREFEYLTAKQMKGEIGFKYSRVIGKKGMKGYTSVRCGITKAFDVEYVEGDSFYEVKWTLGCTF
ncbi:MAG: hypothetical protein LKI29_01255, partial [Bacteroides sp.]|nr:hypothetical protein [Bacteroides sp.]